jgi:hypothetical protein
MQRNQYCVLAPSSLNIGGISGDNGSFVTTTMAVTTATAVEAILVAKATATVTATAIATAMVIWQ